MDVFVAYFDKWNTLLDDIHRVGIDPAANRKLSSCDFVDELVNAYMLVLDAHTRFHVDVKPGHTPLISRRPSFRTP